MPGLMLHCGGESVSFDQLGGFELPPETRTYSTVGHQDLVRLAEDRVRRELNYDDEFQWQHGVNKEGRQYFGLCKLPGIQITEQHCLSMGLRNSYNKTMSVALAFGGNCFVCDNMSFFGNMITVMRTHSGNAMRDLRRLFVEALESCVEDATIHATQIEGWKDYPCEQDLGYKVIGLMRGRGLLTPRMTQNMFHEWQKPAQQAFEPRNVWSLYNAATESIKKVSPQRALKTYSGVHKFFLNDVVEIDALPV